MAIVSNPLIGKTRKSAGGVTFTTWKGRDVLKNKATSVANPRTPLQVSNRNRLSGAAKFYAKNRSQLMLSFLRMMGDITDSNKFVSLNRLCFSPDVVGIDVTKIPDLVLSQGALGSFSETAVTNPISPLVHVEWTYAPNVLQSLATDRIMGLVYSVALGEWFVSDTVAVFGFDSIDITAVMPVGSIGHAFLFSYSETGKKLSNSYYVGQVTAV